MSVLDPKQDAAALQPLEDKALQSLQGDIQGLITWANTILDTYKITIVFEKKVPPPNA
jgi:hypothetical protein